MSSNTGDVDTDVVIIGGGMSGIGLAVQLKRRYKGVTFNIFEKLDDIGGTWAANTYPGCGVDVSVDICDCSNLLT